MRDSCLPNRTEPGRILGIDAVRLFSFYAIIIFHVSYAFWGVDGHLNVPSPSLWIDPFEFYARALSFSGFTVLFLSFFLFGFKTSVKWNYLWILLLAFLAAWTFSTEEVTDAWDIYQYLLAVFLAISLIKFARVPPAAVAFISFIGVSVPFWKLEGLWNLPFEGAIWGNCLHEGARPDWPLLPWIFYPLLAYSVGRLVARHRGEFAVMERKEGLVWLAALAASVPFLGAYYGTDLGLGFGCYIFRRSPLEFWAHQIWIWFFLRVSLTAKVQTRLDRSKLMHWISRRQVNRRFFLVYFLHFPLVFAVANTVRAAGLAYVGWTFAAANISMALLLEAVPVVIGKISAKIKF